jgi:hypothetical protein
MDPAGPFATEPSHLGLPSSPAENAETVFNSLPVRADWHIESFFPTGDCRLLAQDRHGESAWEWVREMEGPMPQLPARLWRTVLRYTGEHYHVINQAMVNGTGPASVMRWAEQMKEAMRSATLPVPLRLYRSSSPRWLHAMGHTFPADHLISTSVDPCVAGNWQPAQPYSRQTLWAIDAPAGTHAVWGTTNNRAQAEVLLDSGTIFKVLEAVRNRRGDALMHLAILPGP